MADRRMILRGGDIVTPDRVVSNGTLVIEDGRIAELLEVTPPVDGAHVRSAEGLVVPGFVGLHCDALEREIRPRPTSVLPRELALPNSTAPWPRRASRPCSMRSPSPRKKAPVITERPSVSPG